MLNENEKFENYSFNFSIFQPVLAVNAYVRTSHSMVVLNSLPRKTYKSFQFSTASKQQQKNPKCFGNAKR